MASSILTFFALSSTAGATDRLFSYAYQTGVLDKGDVEVEPSFTYRTGRNSYYTRLDHRLEFELGLGGNLQTAFYFNHKTEAFDDGLGGVALESKFDGFSNEWKLQLAEPTDALGVGLYAEGTLGPDETELEAKLLLDKVLGGVVLAFNGVYEIEMEQLPDETELAHIVSVLLAGSVEVSPQFHIGLEAREENIIAKGELEHGFVHVGPTLAFRPEAGWIAVTALPQATDLIAGGRNLDDSESFETRVSFGLHL